MTKQQLKAERRLEKIRGRIVRDELRRMKREDEIREKVENAFSILTAIALLALMITAFVIDAVGSVGIPQWLYVAGFGYLAFYGVFAYYRFFK